MLYMFLNFGVDFPVYFGTVADISGIAVKDSLYCYGVALICTNFVAANS